MTTTITTELDKRFASVHEGGHIVVYRLAGIDVERAVVAPDGDSGHVVLSVRDMNAVMEDPDRRDMLLIGTLAGGEAARQWGAETGYKREGDDGTGNDEEFFQSLLPHVETSERELRYRTQRLVTARWRDILHFADLLFERGKIRNL